MDLGNIEVTEERKRRDRQVLSLDDFTDEDLAAIAEAKVPDEYIYLNNEVEE